MATGAVPEAARQRLYDVVIQTCIALGRAREDASDSSMHGAGARSQGCGTRLVTVAGTWLRAAADVVDIICVWIC